MGLHLTSNYTTVWELLNQNLKTMCKYKGDLKLQNELKEINKGSIKNLLESEKKCLYGHTCFSNKLEIENNIQLIIKYNVSIENFDTEKMINHMKSLEKFKQLDDFAVALEKQGATELAAKAKDNSYYKFLKVKELIENYLDEDLTEDFEEQYINLKKAVNEINLH